jgi:hypothetical protein
MLKLSIVHRLGLLLCGTYLFAHTSVACTHAYVRRVCTCAYMHDCPCIVCHVAPHGILLGCMQWVCCVPGNHCLRWAARTAGSCHSGRLGSESMQLCSIVCSTPFAQVRLPKPPVAAVACVRSRPPLLTRVAVVIDGGVCVHLFGVHCVSEIPFDWVSTG